jgi:DNA-binding MarR family transcriptional regulator
LLRAARPWRRRPDGGIPAWQWRPGAGALSVGALLVPAVDRRRPGGGARARAGCDGHGGRGIAQPTNGATVNAVANELGIDQSGASRFIAQAVQRGYLQKVPAARDARERVLHVTPAGEDLLRAAHEWQEAVFADLTAGWSEQDVRQLQGYLERLLDAQQRAG